jgi:hypothetical protein
MALNKQVYDDIPHVSAPQAKQPPGRGTHEWHEVKG